MKFEGDYYIGLDCGTDSVGWAVTDSEYNILKFNGKAMWGSHLFDSANTAQARRLSREARRRYQREKQRIFWTQAMFADEISKIDPTFFIRLNDSYYHVEDRVEKQRNNLFNDANFKDMDFFKRYPTIYHLRKSLIHSNDPSDFDPRFVYLAVSHIMKHRGHFLFPGENMNAVMSIKEILLSLDGLFYDVFEDVAVSLADKCTEIENALNCERNSEKKEKLDEVITASDKKFKAAFIKMVCGNKVKPSDFFDNENYKDLSVIEFSKATFEDSDLPMLESELEDGEFQIIKNIKAIYDWSLLSRILDGSATIAEAKVALYERNHEDLLALKRAIRKYCSKKEYDNFFHGTDAAKSNYVHYTGKDHDLKLERKNKSLRVEKCSSDEFYKRIKGLIEKHANEPDVANILSKIEAKTFLPLLNSFRNGIIPNQIIKEELKKILDNASCFLPFLNEKDEEGYTVNEKLLSMIRFRIPYYVGPLGKNEKGSNTWAVRLDKGTVYPWNFDKKIDRAASQELFIRRMTNKCTYLKDQDVIAKNSILYSKYMVLNDLNNTRLNGERLSVEQKQIIFEKLFLMKKKVTQKALKDFVVKEGWFRKDEKPEISGIDGDYKSSMASYIDFKAYLDEGKLKKNDVEEIIKWITLFGDEPAVIEKNIKTRIASSLSDDDIKRIAKLRYSGWGRFSQKLLDGIYTTNKETGRMCSIMDMLWETGFNFMELMSKNFDFFEQTNDDSVIDKLSYSVVDELYVSPSVKRQIWQTLRIVDEINRIMKRPAKKVFIEVARSEEEKKRTVSRKESLLKNMKSGKISEEDRKIISSLESTDESLISKRDRLYLYYSQMGRCMYSGKMIDIDDLDNHNLYDIDHIYPYSKSNDDSLSNKVLVCSEFNREKSSAYPIQDNIRKNMAGFWKMLKDKELISDEKYHRLTRNTPFTDDEFEQFINRQLVETRQNTKATAEILNRFYQGKAKIVYSKAGPVSDFRDKFKFVKCRSINDLHHAKDAYLNIVVGNILDTKYSRPNMFYRNPEFGKEYYNLSKPFEFNVPGAWQITKGGSLKTVRDNMNRNNILLTRQPVTKNGQLFDLNLLKAGEKKGMLPAKSSDDRLKKLLAESQDKDKTISSWVEKYGGYNSMAISHFALVEYKEKKNEYIEFIPVRIVDRFRLNTMEKLLLYCEKELGYSDAKVIRPVVLINTVLELDGFRLHVAAKQSGSMLLRSATSLVLDNESIAYVKKIENYNNKLKKDKNYKISEKYDGLSKEKNEKLYAVFAEKSNNSIFAKKPGNKGESIKNSFDKFSMLNIEEQIDLLNNILLYFSSNGRCNLSLIKDSPNSGILTMSLRIKKGSKKLYLIDQSITGLFESRIQLS